MVEAKVGDLVKTAIVTAFTIATALIWKDFIVEAINYFFPSGDILFYQFLAALVATIILILGIVVFVKTESQAEVVINRVSHIRDKDNSRVSNMKRK